METRRLFYEDCHMHTFSARVTGCRSGKGGYLVTLDATAFYPEGGGQACDLGVLSDASVLDVQEEDGQILHLCHKPLPVGAQVEGRIDYARRLDLMQQHTGEHIVSGLLHAKFGCHNVGFHMGKEFVEVDFDKYIPWEDLAEIEAAANDAVWKNLPVNCFYPSREELPNVFYRTKRALPWPVRIVQVPGYDSCACCGVHVAHTGEVGLIKILSCVKFHEGVRLQMLCGRRAYQYMSRILEENRQVSQAFSAKMLETGQAAVKMNETLAREKYRAAGLQQRVFEGIAKSYVNQEKVLHFEPDLDSAGIRTLAEKIAQGCQGFAAVFSGEEGKYGFCVVGTGDVGPLCRKMLAALNGRGGGKPNAQQGTLQATEQEIRRFFAEEE